MNSRSASIKRKVIVWLIAMVIGAAGLMVVWNWGTPWLGAQSTINYWQALGVIILVNLVGSCLIAPFRSAQGYQYRQAWQKKWSAMSSEERQALKNKYRNRCKSHSREKKSNESTNA